MFTSKLCWLAPTSGVGFAGHCLQCKPASRGPQHRCIQRALASKKASSGGRPSLQDVENISRGDAAKSRGTGSRQVPHRLNAEERKLYDLAKQKSFLTLKGSGYRAERKGSPLANIYRQFCDASRIPCILVEQGVGNNPEDTVLVDFSPLRQPELSQLHQRSVELAEAVSASQVPDVREHLPFTIISSLDLSPDTQSISDENMKDMEELAIWQIPPCAAAFQAARPEAKQLAADLASALQELIAA